MKIIIKDQQKIKKIKKNSLKLFVQKILKHLNIADNIEVSILLTDNKQIKKMNKIYRNLDKPTDVLAFSMLEEEKTDIIGSTEMILRPEILGDIVISIEQAQIQSSIYDNSFQKEFDLLIIHGILHLLGYDHIEEKDAKEMNPLQDDLLNIYGEK